MTTTIKIPSGATLSGLSKQYGATIAELQKLNPSITDINKIYAGANLVVPTPVTSKEQIEIGIAQITPKIEELGKQIAQKQAELAIKEIPSEPTIKDLTKGAVIKPPVLSEEKPSVTDQFTKSLLENLENQRKLSEQTYQKQIDEANKKAEEVKKQLSEVTAKQEKILTTDIEPLTQPFRETLEKSERERLKIEENYFANQQLTSELEGLLTDIQNQVKIEKEQTGLASIRTPTIAKSAEDMTARVGVIEAVMAVRNNQISVAENLIDRTSTAIATDRKDQLFYYQTLFKFYQQERDETGEKLLSLEKEEKEYIQKKISLIEDDLTQVQKSADYIKDLMVNPQTADLMAKAGIKLTDTVEEINSKMNEQVYKDEIIDLSKEMVKSGYRFLTPEIAQTKSEEELIKIPDSRGKEQIFWKKPEIEILSVQNGLYDVTNEKWIVEPKKNATLLDEIRALTVEQMTGEMTPVVGQLVYKSSGLPATQDLPTSMVTKITSLRSYLNEDVVGLLPRIQELLNDPNVNTEGVTAKIKELAYKKGGGILGTGGLNEKEIELSNLISILNNEYLYTRSGAQINEQEQKRLSVTQPQFGYSKQVNLQKANDFIKTVQSIMNENLNAYGVEFKKESLSIEEEYQKYLKAINQ